MNLKHLANKHATDKYTHGYMPFYERHLPRHVNSLMEIGVLKGHSLHMWREAYPDAKLYGLDLFQENPVPTIPGVQFFKGNQLDPTVLDNIRNNIRPQIIVEDGSHNSRDQWVTMISLIGSCDYYFVEDLHCCHYDSYRQGLPFEYTLLGCMLNHTFPFRFTLSDDHKIAVISC